MPTKIGQAVRARLFGQWSLKDMTTKLLTSYLISALTLGGLAYSASTIASNQQTRPQRENHCRLTI